MNSLFLAKLTTRIATTFFFVLFSLLMLPGSADAQTGIGMADRELQQWKFFEPEGSGFRVSLPAQPSRAIVPFETPTSTLDMYLFAARTTSSTYSVSYFDLDISLKEIKALEAGFDRTRAEITDKIPGITLISEKKFAVGKIPAREFIFEGGANNYKMQMYLLRQRVYVVQLNSPQMRNLPEALVKVYQAESDKFFNSFQILDVKKAEVATKGKTAKAKSEK